MHDIHHVVEARKQEATQKKGAPMEEKSTNNPKKNPDPITGKPGAHPVGTGAGAAGGGLAGAAIGGAVGGPVGAAVGAAVGGGCWRSGWRCQRAWSRGSSQSDTRGGLLARKPSEAILRRRKIYL